MTLIDEEGAWFAALADRQKLRFLSVLGHELTVVGRNSYRPQTEELDKPAQLRRVNEVQHRVLACLAQLLAGTCAPSFQRSIAEVVLQQSDAELRQLMAYAWSFAKERLA